MSTARKKWNSRVKQLHIVTPFSRLYLFDTLVNLLKPLNVQWHLMTEQPMVNTLLPIIKLYEATDWIHPVETPTRPIDWSICWRKINQFINTQNIVDVDYYTIMNDDDAIESSAVEELKKTDAEIVVISMKRGDRTPRHLNGAPPRWSPHGFSTLLASPECMKPGSIGPNQIIYSGKIFRTLQYKNVYAADGEMAEYVFNTYKDKIVYKPELFALFNYYEPTRWDKLT